MAARPYTPAPESLAARVLGFFQANHDEELQIADIAVKFHVAASAVPACLSTPVKRGLLARSKTKPYTYRLTDASRQKTTQQPPPQPTRKAEHGIKKIYLSGPMTGLPNLNFPAFHAEAARLRTRGFEVVNPAELHKDPGANWHACLRTDLKAMLDCDGLVLLDGWQRSAGAHLEIHVAHRVGLSILEAQEI